MPDTIALLRTDIDTDITDQVEENAITPAIVGGLLDRMALLVDERLISGGDTRGATLITGTKDAYGYGIITNNVRRMTVTASGRMLFGTTTEGTYDIDIVGSVRMTGNYLQNKAGGTPHTFHTDYIFNGADNLAMHYDVASSSSYQKILTIANSYETAGTGIRRVGIGFNLAPINDSAHVRKMGALTYEATSAGNGDGELCLWVGNTSNVPAKRKTFSPTLETSFVASRVKVTSAGAVGASHELFNDDTSANTAGEYIFTAGDRTVAKIRMLRKASTNGPGAFAFYVRESDAVGLVEKIRIDNTGMMGFLTTSPTSYVDVNSANGYNQLRLRTSYTPSSSSDTNGNTGDHAWDDSYVYVKVSTGWKRAALSTF